MLSKRFKYDGKPDFSLNELQIRMKQQVEKKIEEGIYSVEEVLCCVCGGKNFEILSEKDRYGLYTPVVICKDCGLIYTNPRMTQKAYNEFYDTEYRKLYIGEEVPTEAYFRVQYRSGKRIYGWLKESLGIDLTNLKVFEVGTGAGGILYYFKERGNEVYGCDLDSEYLAFGRDSYNLNLEVGTIKDVVLPWTPDIVIYSHVLEHVLNPVDELIKLKSIMMKVQTHTHIYVYIELPGVKYLTHSHHEMNFLRQLQNAPVYYFTLRTLKNVLGKAGYDLVRGNEIIYSIFKPSQERDYENDYDDAISFLRKMEYYRFMPVSYDNVKRLAMLVMSRFLKIVGLYNMAQKTIYKIKRE